MFALLLTTDHDLKISFMTEITIGQLHVLDIDGVSLKVK